MHWLALALAVAANVAANLSFKFGVREVPVSLDWGVFWRSLLLRPWVRFGLLTCILLLGCYLYPLRGVPLSVAYPTLTGLVQRRIRLIQSSLPRSSLQHSGLWTPG